MNISVNIRLEPRKLDKLRQRFVIVLLLGHLQDGDQGQGESRVHDREQHSW